MISNNGFESSKTIYKAETAKRIHDKGYGARSLARVDAEDFFIRLRDAIISEYTEYGYCELIDEYIINRPSKVDVLAYSAIAQVSNVIKYQKGKDIYIPLENGVKSITWEMANSQTIQTDMDPNLVLNNALKANAKGRRMHADYLKNSMNSDRAMAIDSEREARRIIEEAKAEANRIIDAANDKVKSVETTPSSKKVGGIFAQDKEVLGNGSKEQLLDYQKKYRRDCEREIAGLVDRNQKNLYKTEQFHDQMCAKTNELQATWTRSIASVVEEMNSIKDDFYKYLHSWQKGLYPHEYEQLAERYLELYRIIDIDKLIVDAVFENNKLDVIGKESQSLSKLQKLDETMHIFLHKFEVSLNGLGLYVYRADEGTDFDYVWHMNEDDSAECDGKKIKKCLAPGIARRVIGDGEDDVIIPALVSV